MIYVILGALIPAALLLLFLYKSRNPPTSTPKSPSVDTHNSDAGSSEPDCGIKRTTSHSSDQSFSQSKRQRVDKTVTHTNPIKAPVDIIISEAGDDALHLKCDNDNTSISNELVEPITGTIHKVGSPQTSKNTTTGEAPINGVNDSAEETEVPTVLVSDVVKPIFGIPASGSDDICTTAISDNTDRNVISDNTDILISSSLDTNIDIHSCEESVDGFVEIFKSKDNVFRSSSMEEEVCPPCCIELMKIDDFKTCDEKMTSCDRNVREKMTSFEDEVIDGSPSPVNDFDATGYLQENSSDLTLDFGSLSLGEYNRLLLEVNTPVKSSGLLLEGNTPAKSSGLLLEGNTPAKSSGLLLEGNTPAKSSGLLLEGNTPAKSSGLLLEGNTPAKSSGLLLEGNTSAKSSGLLLEGNTPAKSSGLLLEGNTHVQSNSVDTEGSSTVTDDGLSEVRPTEDVSLNEVKNHQGHVTCVHKELSDIVCTKEKKKTLLKEVEVRGEVKENKSVVLAELDKLSQIACNAGDDNVSLVNISVEKKKKEAALGEIELIGRSKSQKESMQRELTTISVARDAKCGALQEIRDIAQTKETKKGVMEDISKRKVVKDARNNVLSDINKIGSINANVFAAVKGQECEPLPRVYTASLGVISEINEMGQRKETKTEALKELVTVQKTKNVKASAMTELKGISDTKSKKEASLKEIRDRESSKESKNMAMAELKKVADIKEKVVGDAPIGLFEIDIAIHNKAMQDIDSLGKQKESKGEAMKELLTISSSKVTKEKVLGEINQLGKTRSAKAGVHRELKRNIENMENEPTRQNVLGDIAAIGQEKEQSLSNLEKTITKKQNHSSILSEIAGIQKTKEQGQQDVENNLKEKLEKAKLKEQNAASLDEIRKIKEEQETGRENLEAHFAKHVNKQGE